MRIDKYISSQINGLSRADVKKLIRSGSVTLDGKSVKSPDTQVDEKTCRVCVNGEEITYREHVYIMLNKPAGYVCSARGEGSPTVTELVPEHLRRRGLFAAGRLDKDTEGFVLITDDGELAHRMLAPSRHVPKTYFVRLEKPYDRRYAEVFAEGAEIDGGEKCLPAECSADPSDRFACFLTLHEGKYHQVKRMFESVGNKVAYLKRIRIGDLDLNADLALGECLEILHKDVEKLLCAKN